MRFSIWFNILIVFFGEYSFAIGLKKNYVYVTQNLIFVSILRIHSNMVRSFKFGNANCESIDGILRMGIKVEYRAKKIMFSKKCI